MKINKFGFQRFYRNHNKNLEITCLSDKINKFVDNREAGHDNR